MTVRRGRSLDLLLWLDRTCMLTSAGCAARRARLWQRVSPHWEWLLIADPRHVHYLSNFWIGPLSFSAGERGLLLLERDGSATLLADNFALRSAAGPIHVTQEIEEAWYDHRQAVANRDHALFAAVDRAAERLKGRPGAVEAEWLPLAAAERLGVTGSSPAVADSERGPISLGTLLRELRRSKDEDELALLRQAMRATDAGHARAREVVREGVSEWDVYREVQTAAIAAAGRPATIYGDFRATTAELIKAGGPPTDYVLRRGNLFILDYSVVLDGYRSDFTNTLSIGPPTEGQEMLFGLCSSALKNGQSVLRAGIPAKDVHAAVMGPFAAAGYGHAFPHHAGHGLGLGHPEPPILVPESSDILVAGDVITLEPGAYVAGIGGMRIEHNFLITPTGSEQLSGHVISLT